MCIRDSTHTPCENELPNNIERFPLFQGPERKRRIHDEEANLITVYHESGHAVVAYFTKEASPLHTVIIIPHGQSLGHVSTGFRQCHYQIINMAGNESFTMVCWVSNFLCSYN